MRLKLANSTEWCMSIRIPALWMAIFIYRNAGSLDIQLRKHSAMFFVCWNSEKSIIPFLEKYISIYYSTDFLKLKNL